MADRAPSEWNRNEQRSREGVLPAAAAACVALACSMGCLNLSFGGRSTTAEEAAVFSQNGTAVVMHGQIMDIYYPVAYVSPPNLELDESTATHCQVVEQKADHFRVRNNNALRANVKWTARGTRTTQPAVVPQQPAVTVETTRNSGD